MKVGNIIAWTLVTAIGLFGIYAGVGIKKLMSICYSITKYKLVQIDLEYIYINFTLTLKNKSFLKVDIEGYNFDVYLNNKFVTALSSKKHEEIAGEGISVIDIPLKVAYLKTFKTVGGNEILNAFTEKKFDRIFVTLKGTFSGSVLKVPVNVPVDYKITLEEIIKIMDAPASAPC